MKTGERIRSFRRQAGLTLEELAGLVGTSKQTVYRYESGEIENIPRGRIEAIAKVLHQSPAALMGWEGDSLSSYGILSCKRRAVPLLGKIACGQPIYAEEEFCGYMPLGDEIEADFCLRACGDSMIGARIFDGDIVFVKAQDAVENGEIAVVIADGEATLKRLYFDAAGQRLVLSPENPHYAPLVFTGEELSSVKVLGKAVAFQSTVR